MMAKDFDKLLDILITLMDMALAIGKGVKKLRKLLKKKLKNKPN